eukprot:GILK01001918.1.p1 GENE.GILK01001918.1~~GILK01001918.1.p1  ORF type:complete len:957 (-),score=216.57 GILK01001918.1:325-3051(-)
MAAATRARAFSTNGDRLRLLLISNSHNSMSQRAALELQKDGHEVAVELAINEASFIQSKAQFKPHLIFAPFLTKRVPDVIWRDNNVPCLIVHPGIKGDRGASSIDWALSDKSPEWGVTVLQAAEEMDAGDIWSSKNFPLQREHAETLTKSSVYKNEAVSAAMSAIRESIHKFQNKIPAEPLDYTKPDVKGTLRPNMKQADRKVNWSATAEEVASTIRFSDGSPGVLDSIQGEEYYMFGAHAENLQQFNETIPVKTILGYRHGAILLKTGKGAVWISHLKKKTGPVTYKVPATLAIPQPLLRTLNRLPEPSLVVPYGTRPRTFQEIWVTERNGVCYLHFEFYNGAMSTSQCRRLEAVVKEVGQNPRYKAIALMGGYDYFSNGIHINQVVRSGYGIESESWANINAINDVVKATFSIHDKYVVSAFQGNAGAGGVMAALAADDVVAHSDVVLNPHYKSMGLYGSEYWTYFLPRRVGKETARNLTERLQPLLATSAESIGLVDRVLGQGQRGFQDRLHSFIESTLNDKQKLNTLLKRKSEERLSGQWLANVERHRGAELSIMRDNFRDQAYHVAVQRFVNKSAALCTPQHLKHSDMTATVLDGNDVSKRVKVQLKSKIDSLVNRAGRKPKLVVMLVGNHEPSKLFTRRKQQAGTEVGIDVELLTIDESTPALEQHILNHIARLNADDSVDGLMVQLPLPGSVNSSTVLETISLAKDVDGLHPVSLFSMLHNKPESNGFVPTVARGVVELLMAYDIKVPGKRAVVVGSSPYVGLPISLSLSQMGATVVVCQNQSVTLEEEVRRADILVSSVGIPHLIKGDWIKKGSVVIDVGVSMVMQDNGKFKVTGDVEYDSAVNRASFITPVPGGTGPMTVAMLLRNTTENFERRVLAKDRASSSMSDLTSELEASAAAV